MDIYKNNEDRKKYIDNYFTEKGEKALMVRLESLANIYLDIETKYPFIARIFGFPTLQIESREQLQGMMEELRQILGLKEIVMEARK